MALAIAAAQIAKLNLKNITIARFAKGLLNGCGAMRPLGEAELRRWYNNLVEDGYIAA